MTIQGVKGITKNTLTSYRIQLDRMETNGHDFCELIVDEKHKNFTARLYGGEVYTYGWEVPGDDFLDFLIDTFSERSGYLYMKLADLSKEEFVDMPETMSKIKEMIDAKLRDGFIDVDTATDLIEEAESFENDELLSVDNFYNVYLEEFSEVLRTEVLSEEPWEADYVVTKKDENTKVFCEKVAPILARVLQEERTSTITKA